MDRIEQLQKFLRDDPHDPFNHYALALEYLKTDLQQAALHLQELLTHHPSYLPTYYQAGNVFEILGKRDAALTILKTGIDLARQQHQPKTQRELQTVYDELVDS